MYQILQRLLQCSLQLFHYFFLYLSYILFCHTLHTIERAMEYTAHRSPFFKVFSDMTFSIRRALMKVLNVQIFEDEESLVIDDGEEVRVHVSGTVISSQSLLHVCTGEQVAYCFERDA